MANLLTVLSESTVRQAVFDELGKQSGVSVLNFSAVSKTSKELSVRVN
jgi:hypothetical protein